MTAPSTLFDSEISVQVSSNLPKIYSGPENVFGYTIVQGFLTVLTIKEVVSLTRFFVKGTKQNLRLNRIILWHMVENWEDLFKVTKQFFFPKRMHSLQSDHLPKVHLNRKAYRRFIFSFAIWFFIFMIDMVLIVLSVPTRVPQAASEINGIQWDNGGKIMTLTKANVLQGSFSRSIKLSTRADDIEFTRLPSVSLERTDFRDFDIATFPEYNGVLFSCNSTEQWRIVCQVFCDRHYYQYKLRLDVSSDGSSSAFFVPTSAFSVTTGPNLLQDYVDAIEKQLGISATGHYANSTYFEIRSPTVPSARTRLKTNENSDDSTVLTHDAIATLFLGTVRIQASSRNVTYYERKTGERRENLAVVSGNIAISQRPYLPLLGTLFIYVTAQLFSIFLQTSLHLHAASPELNALLEIAGVHCTENTANVSAEDLELVYSKSAQGWDVEEGGGGGRGHVGYLPVGVVERVREFRREGEKGRLRHGVVEKEDLENVAKVG